MLTENNPQTGDHGGTQPTLDVNAHEFQEQESVDNTLRDHKQLLETFSEDVGDADTTQVTPKITIPPEADDTAKQNDDTPAGLQK